MLRLSSFLISIFSTVVALSDENPYSAQRCELIPLPEHQVVFRIDGIEKTRWHFAEKYPRPFFYPFNGPSGASLTRMGHPGAPNHDHHRSIWFAHNNVNGQDYWSDGTGTQVRQQSWYTYQDGNDEAVMASLSGWFDQSGNQVMQQQVVAAIIPLDDGGHALEIQLTMRPPGNAQQVILGKTNFGFLAIRVAKSLSAHFGGGQLTNSENQQGEPEIFGKRARWVDYSGPIAIGHGSDRKLVTEGITCFDHPDNPRYPTHWHVREDGWMGASFCMQDEYIVTSDNPLTLRYLIHAHSGAYNQADAADVHEAFANRPRFEVAKSTKPHRQYQVQRLEPAQP